MAVINSFEIKTAVIFGGTGFIGSFFSKALLDKKLFNKIYLVDLDDISEKDFHFRKKFLQGDKRINFIRGDVRKNLDDLPIKDEINLICNFAAIHREPGHEKDEYFETNLLGAENVCKWAESVSCKKIIFTSSISPYGISENFKDESTLPAPDTPYGSSKLIAEKIHENWRLKNQSNSLIIIRPGVVFGPSEGGNVSRLINAVIKGYFVFMGNNETKKAGIYIKELCNMLIWEMERQEDYNLSFSLLNASMMPIPTVSNYFDVICEVAGIQRRKLNIHYRLVLIIAYFIKFFISPLGFGKQFNPIRIKKLVRSNLVVSDYLKKNKYNFEFDLKKAFEDWKSLNPDDWK